MTTRYIPVTETAKLVRAALKKAFPEMKFSVKSKSYSGGASIDIHWIDGPTAYEVEQVTSKFQGSTFDSSIDLKSSVTGELDGEKVQFGSDYIFCERKYTVAFLQRCAETVARDYGQPTPVVKETAWGAAIDPDYSWTTGNGTMRTLADLIMQKAARTRAVA